MLQAVTILFREVGPRDNLSRVTQCCYKAPRRRCQGCSWKRKVFANASVAFHAQTPSVGRAKPPEAVSEDEHPEDRVSCEDTWPEQAARRDALPFGRLSKTLRKCFHPSSRMRPLPQSFGPGTWNRLTAERCSHERTDDRPRGVCVATEANDSFDSHAKVIAISQPRVKSDRNRVVDIPSHARRQA